MAQNQKGVAQTVKALAEPLAEEFGYILWDVEFVREGSRRILRITIDSEEGITVEDCVFKVKMRMVDTDNMAAIVSWSQGPLSMKNVLTIFDREDNKTPITGDDEAFMGVTTCLLSEVEKNYGIAGLDYSAFSQLEYFVIENYIPIFVSAIA